MPMALPTGTSLKKPVIQNTTAEDALLWESNKWLLAHKDSDEAKQGAHIGLVGENWDLAKM